MRLHHSPWAYGLALFVTLSGNAYTKVFAESNLSTQNELPVSIVRAEVRSDVMSFADRFTAMIEQAASQLTKQRDIEEGRLMAARFRVGAVASAIDIASGPHPGVALLDMMVFVNLNRIVWEEYWHPRRFSGKADQILEALKKLEREIWSIGLRILTPAQEAELRELIAEWRKKNPNQWDVNFIRFSSFGSLGHKPSLHLATKPGGLLGPIQEAADAAEEVREVAERAMYLLTRMQLLAGFQVDLMFQEFVQQPEVKHVLSDTTRLTAISEDLSRRLEQMPVQMEARANKVIANLAEQVKAERKATIDHFMKELAAERGRLFGELDSRDANLHRLLSQIGQLVTDGGSLASQAKGTIDSLNSFATRLSGVNVEQLRVFALGAKETAQELNTSLESIDRLLGSPAWEKRRPELITMIDRAEGLTKGLANQIFMLIAGLVLFFFIVRFAYGLASRKVFGPHRGSARETERERDGS